MEIGDNIKDVLGLVHSHRSIVTLADSASPEVKDGEVPSKGENVFD